MYNEYRTNMNQNIVSNKVYIVYRKALITFSVVPYILSHKYFCLRHDHHHNMELNLPLQNCLHGGILLLFTHSGDNNEQKNKFEYA